MKPSKIIADKAKWAQRQNENLGYFEDPTMYWISAILDYLDEEYEKSAPTSPQDNS